MSSLWVAQWPKAGYIYLYLYTRVVRDTKRVVLRNMPESVGQGKLPESEILSESADNARAKVISKDLEK